MTMTMKKALETAQARARKHPIYGKHHNEIIQLRKQKVGYKAIIKKLKLKDGTRISLSNWCVDFTGIKKPSRVQRYAWETHQKAIYDGLNNDLQLVQICRNCKYDGIAHVAKSLREWIDKQGGRRVFMQKYKAGKIDTDVGKPGPKPKATAVKPEPKKRGPKPGPREYRKKQAIEDRHMPPKSRLYPWEDWKPKLYECLSKGDSYRLTVQRCGITEKTQSAANALSHWLKYFGGRDHFVQQYEREAGRADAKEAKVEENAYIAQLESVMEEEKKAFKSEKARLLAYIVQLESMLEDDSIDQAKVTHEAVMDIITQ